MTFAEKVIKFNEMLHFDGQLPSGIHIINPYREDKHAITTSRLFYNKFFSDTNERHIILGINPGRFGSCVTGVSFTDTRRLKKECDIVFTGKAETYEPSSVFIYEMINAYGGSERFYKDFYINSVCPLGFTRTNSKGKEVNYNYYDDAELRRIMLPFIISSTWNQISLGINRDVGFCLGTGKNEKFLRSLNEEHKFFKTIIAVEHPRYIMQYKSRYRGTYIAKYLDAFNRVK